MINKKLFFYLIQFCIFQQTDGLIELVVSIISIFILKRFGRRKSLAGGMCLCSFGLLASAIALELSDLNSSNLFTNIFKTALYHLYLRKFYFLLILVIRTMIIKSEIR